MDRLAELEREVNHWKANHKNIVEKCRILIDRTDLPLERVRAFELLSEYDLLLTNAHDIIESLQKPITTMYGQVITESKDAQALLQIIREKLGK